MSSVLKMGLAMILVVGGGRRLAAQDNIDDQIKAKQDAINALEQKLAPKIQPLLVENADVRLWVSSGVPGLVANFFDSLSGGQRHLHYDAASEAGQLKNSNGGALGCGWFLTLEGGNSAHADVDLRNLTATVNGTGAVDLSLGFHFSFSAQIHGHVKGPPGPCSLWNPWPSCNCPIGGGAGTSVGTSGEQGGTVTASIVPHSDPNGWLAYDLSLNGPANIPITVSASLQGIGSVGIPMSVNLPLGVISTGSMPSVFSGTGTINVPNVLARQYSFTLQPKPLTVDKTGYAVTADVQIAWK